MDKKEIFNKIEIYIRNKNIRIDQFDDTRPWGGFFVVNEADADTFIKEFFPEISEKDLLPGAKLSPKILLVQPGKKLSWQYHHRRAEIWKLIDGTASISRSDTDHEKSVDKMSTGEVIRLKQGERHRLIGTDRWGVIAEIWMHTDPTNPSDEEDIIRLQDDFGDSY